MTLDQDRMNDVLFEEWLDTCELFDNKKGKICQYVYKKFFCIFIKFPQVFVNRQTFLAFLAPRVLIKLAFLDYFE